MDAEALGIEALPQLDWHTLAFVRGCGDVGSAVAHALFSNGYSVILHDRPTPTASRRGMAFTDALFDGSAHLEGIEARLMVELGSVPATLAERRFIPVTGLDLSLVLAHLQPNVLVDARMRKHHVPEDQRHLAPLTIGLGPNFTVGGNVHLAVETARGDDLGEVIESGSTRPLSGEPQLIDGHGRERYVYAPVAGRFETALRIGDPVQQGAPVARIGACVLRAPLSGRLRGLTRHGVEIAAGAKLIEVDTRGIDAQIYGIGERQRLIAEGVLRALRSNAVADGAFVQSPVPMRASLFDRA